MHKHVLSQIKSSQLCFLLVGFEGAKVFDQYGIGSCDEREVVIVYINSPAAADQAIDASTLTVTANYSYTNDNCHSDPVETNYTYTLKQ